MSDVTVMRIEESTRRTAEASVGDAARGHDHLIKPGVFARVGPGVRRKITTGDEPVALLAIGATPGEAYAPPPFTLEGAPLPG